LKYGQSLLSHNIHSHIQSGLQTQNGIGSKLKSQQIETIYCIIQQHGRNQATELKIWPVHHSVTIYTATIKNSLWTQMDWIQTQEPTDTIQYNTTTWKKSSNRTRNMAGSPFSHNIHSHNQKWYMDPNVTSIEGNTTDIQLCCTGTN